MCQSVRLPTGLHVRWTSGLLASERKIEPPFHRIVGVVLYRYRRRVLSSMQLTHEKLDDPVNPRLTDILPDCPNVPYLKTGGPSRCRFHAGRDTNSAYAQACQTAPHCAYRPSCCDRICSHVQGRKRLLCASCNAPKFISGKKPWTGRIANHVRPNVGQPAFERSCQTCRATFGGETRPSHRCAWPMKYVSIVARLVRSPDQNVLTKASLYQ
ncbi:hypothetical protein F4801DRAFT_427446 [Xylaria longipes]|nr:hypothetical protein F4801DRAFT_427446 [Xylaria longipes]